MRMTLLVGETIHNNNGKKYTDPDEIARLILDHLSHLGNIYIGYEVPYKGWKRHLLQSKAKSVQNFAIK